MSHAIGALVIAHFDSEEEVLERDDEGGAAGNVGSPLKIGPGKKKAIISASN